MFVVGYHEERYGYYVDKFFKTEDDFDKWFELKNKEYMRKVTLYQVDQDKIYCNYFEESLTPYKNVTYQEQVSYILAKGVYNEVYGYCNYFPTTKSLVLYLTSDEDKAKVFKSKEELPKWYREYGYWAVERVTDGSIVSEYLGGDYE